MERPSATEFETFWEASKWEPNQHFAAVAFPEGAPRFALSCSATRISQRRFDFGAFESAEDAITVLCHMDALELARVRALMKSSETAQWLMRQPAFSLSLQLQNAKEKKKTSKYKEIDDEYYEAKLREYFAAETNRRLAQNFGSFYFNYSARPFRLPAYEFFHAVSYAMHRALSTKFCLSSGDAIREATGMLKLLDTFDKKLEMLSFVDEQIAKGGLAHRHNALRKRLAAIVLASKQEPWNVGKGLVLRKFLADFRGQLWVLGVRNKVSPAVACNLVFLLDPDALISTDTAERYLDKESFGSLVLQNLERLAD